MKLFAGSSLHSVLCCSFNLHFQSFIQTSEHIFHCQKEAFQYKLAHHCPELYEVDASSETILIVVCLFSFRRNHSGLADGGRFLFY